MTRWVRLGTVAFGFVLAASFLSACGSPYTGSTIGQQVQSWATTSPDPQFSAAMSMLQGDLRRVASAQVAHDDAALRTDCDVLVTDALSANQNLPTPDGQLTKVLSEAYSSAASAGKTCLCAAGAHTCSARDDGSRRLFEQADAQSAVAERGFIKAEARVDLLTILSGNR